MSVGGGYGSPPGQPYGMLASESDREACQAVLKQAFEDERLNQDEFEARVGKAVAARAAPTNGWSSSATGCWAC